MFKLSWYLEGDKGGPSEQSLDIDGKEPISIGRNTDCTITLGDTTVSRHHATLTLADDTLDVHDEDSSNGTFIDGQRISDDTLSVGAALKIGPYIFELSGPPPTEEKTQLIKPDDAKTKIVKEDPNKTKVVKKSERRTKVAPPTADKGKDGDRPKAKARSGSFPPPWFDAETVPIKKIKSSGALAGETDYLAIGGGIGSFVWVDHLRVFGVKAEQIRALGVDSRPYGKFERLRRYSQIPDHERLRSNSISTPDNIWGFPGYASRETVKDIKNGKFSGIRHIFQVFGEPALAESYTPKAGDVFDSLDVEAERIGWKDIWMPGRVLKIRKTDDGRYAVAYRVPADHAKSDKRNFYYVCRFLHIATGYPASRYLPDLQDFKRRHPQSNKVVNAYEDHEEIYEQLASDRKGTVLIRGRGIVASRILQRLSELRNGGADIRVLHVMRRPISTGNSYDLSKRHAAHDIEYQPFNWPKSCWGGTYRVRLEEASPEERAKLYAIWGGTTTAERSDWDAILADGKREGWYRPFFGSVKEIKIDGDAIVTELESSLEFKERLDLKADYVVDCTGLISDLEANPLLADIIKTYRLPRNRVTGSGAEQQLSGIEVTNSYEIAGLRNAAGRAYASGSITQNGPYAAVDSYLGLQYTALRSVDSLQAAKAPGVSSFGPVKSFSQWLKWCWGTKP